jgi:1-acyl-sn-glycerol-3-phosphate acyltransferase
MKYILSIYFWTVGGLVFGLILIFAIIISYIVPPETYDPWLKKMLHFVFKIFLTKVEVEGEELVEQGKPYLFMANHVSIFDVVLLAGYIPAFVRAVEADRQHKWPLYGWAVKRYGNIAIARDNPHRSIKSLGRAEKYLKSGKSIVILPEGHRTLDGNLRAFKKLPFLMAKQAGVDIVPVGLSGLFTMKRKGSWLIQPTTLKIKFGPILPADTVKSLSVVELRDITRDRIKGLIEKP